MRSAFSSEFYVAAFFFSSEDIVLINLHDPVIRFSDRVMVCFYFSNSRVICVSYSI